MKVKNITSVILNKIIEIIVSFKPVEKIVLFGSRATEDHSERSDIDIAIFSDQWTNRDVNLVKDRLEESVKTPLKFDLLIYNDVSKKELKRAIIDEGRVVYESKKD